MTKDDAVTAEPWEVFRSLSTPATSWHDEAGWRWRADKFLASLNTAPAVDGPTDAHVAAKARAALGEWLAWPDAGRDGTRAVTNEQVESWLHGLPNKLGYARRHDAAAAGAWSVPDAYVGVPVMDEGAATIEGHPLWCVPIECNGGDAQVAEVCGGSEQEALVRAHAIRRALVGLGVTDHEIVPQVERLLKSDREDDWVAAELIQVLASKLDALSPAPANADDAREPVAWLYERNGYRRTHHERMLDYTTPAMGFTETPLYAHPTESLFPATEDARLSAMPDREALQRQIDADPDCEVEAGAGK